MNFAAQLGQDAAEKRAGAAQSVAETLAGGLGRGLGRGLPPRAGAAQSLAETLAGGLGRGLPPRPGVRLGPALAPPLPGALPAATPAAAGGRWFSRAPSPLVQTLIGAGAGAAKAGIEQGADVLDPNISPEGRWAHFGLNVAGGAALGNPAARRAMFLRKTTMPVPDRPGTSISRYNFRPLNAFGLTSAYMGLPHVTNAVGGPRRLARAPRKGLPRDDVITAPRNPAASGKEVVTNAATRAVREAVPPPAAVEAAPPPAAAPPSASPSAPPSAAAPPPAAVGGARPGPGSFGNTLAGGLGGGLVGGTLGGLAGHLFSGDDPALPHEARRRRERWRTLLRLGGTAAGGIAAPALLSRYAPDLIPNTINRVMPGDRAR